MSAVDDLEIKLASVRAYARHLHGKLVQVKGYTTSLRGFGTPVAAAELDSLPTGHQVHAAVHSGGRHDRTWLGSYTKTEGGWVNEGGMITTTKSVAQDAAAGRLFHGAAASPEAMRRNYLLSSQPKPSPREVARTRLRAGVLEIEIPGVKGKGKVERHGSGQYSATHPSGYDSTHASLDEAVQAILRSARRA